MARILITPGGDVQPFEVEGLLSYSDHPEYAVYRINGRAYDANIVQVLEEQAMPTNKDLCIRLLTSVLKSHCCLIWCKNRIAPPGEQHGCINHGIGKSCGWGNNHPDWEVDWASIISGVSTDEFAVIRKEFGL